MNFEPTVRGPHSHDFSSLATCLRSFGNVELVYVPHPGNAGDSVINVGTHLFLDDLGVSYRVGSYYETYPDRVVVMSGGGAFVDIYQKADAFLRRNHQVVKALVLLPHTVRAFGNLFAELDSRCHVFAREVPSFLYLQDHCREAHVGLSHDMAFYLDAERIAALSWKLDTMTRRRARAWLKMYLKLLWEARRGDGSIVCLRTDAEAAGTPAKGEHRDLSRWFATGDMGRNASFNSTKMLARAFGAFHHVTADRLHLAILATLLGKDVEMRDNSYGKNSSIYTHSIAGYFPNCRLTGPVTQK